MGEEIALPPDEAHHAARVARVRVGEEVELFDGCGRRIRGAVSSVSKRDVSVEVRSDETTPEPGQRLTLLQAWLHRDKNIETVVRRGTEIGVRRFCFFRAQRSEKKPRMNDKWRRIAIEACKQCGRLWVPEFEVVDSFAAALDGPHERLLIATSELPPVPMKEAVCGEAIALAVGPEGDFAAEELELARSRDAIPISLGTATYRSEAAAILACSLILYEMGGLGE